MRSARRKKTHPSTRTAFESLESRAMFAGLGTDSLSGLGSTTAVLLSGSSSPAGIVLTGGSPTLGSASGTSGSQPNGPVLLGGSGSGSGSSTGGSGSSTPNGPVLFCGTGSGSGSSTSGSGSSTPNGPVLFCGTGSGSGSSTSGSGSSTPNGPVLFCGTGSGSGSSTSGSSSSAPNGPVLLSGTGSGAGSTPSGTGGSSAPNGPVLLGGSGSSTIPTSAVSGGLLNYLPSGYEIGPNSASDPVFQQGYAQWMAASMLATTTTSTSASVNAAPTTSSPGILGSFNNWFSYEYNTWVAIVQNPGATLGGAWDGAVDGAAMAANAATFHQIDSLDDYVNHAISQNGGVYGTANYFAHIGAYAGEAAIVVYAGTTYFTAPLYHYTTAAGAQGIALDGVITGPVWATNLPPSVVLNPYTGPIARTFLGWVGPYQVGTTVSYMPLTQYFAVPGETFAPSLIKLFQFYSQGGVVPLP
jgi:hypothetical protein